MKPHLRNQEGKRYQAIKDYIEQSGSRCILLTATPYNKTYLDLSAQLQLFLRPDADLGIKPEAYIRSIGGEMQFRRRHSTSPVRSLLAFEQSPEPEDWQQLMSRYMVRRTRSFIKTPMPSRTENDTTWNLPMGGDPIFQFVVLAQFDSPLGNPRVIPMRGCMPIAWWM